MPKWCGDNIVDPSARVLTDVYRPSAIESTPARSTSPGWTTLKSKVIEPRGKERAKKQLESHTDSQGPRAEASLEADNDKDHIRELLQSQRNEKLDLAS